MIFIFILTSQYNIMGMGKKQGKNFNLSQDGKAKNQANLAISVPQSTAKSAKSWTKGKRNQAWGQARKFLKILQSA